MAAWREFFAELDLWPVGQATFWWRDDDAVEPCRSLDKLLRLGDQPVAIAVIPANMRLSLVESLEDDRVDVLQHGYSHANHEPNGPGESELGLARPEPVVLNELERGRRWLEKLFGSRFVPVLVPPWYRIADSLVRQLGGLGYGGLSTYGARPAKGAGPTRVNVHADIVNWHPKPRFLRPSRPRFLGTEAALELLTAHLAARRKGEADPEEPTGLVTHHRQMGDACFAFAEEFLARSKEHPAVSWRAARDIFASEHS
jgi:hypothetical protein